MLNLDETVASLELYKIQRDSFLEGVSNSIAVFPFLNILRAQIPEIELVQLVPGSYIVVIFCVATILAFCSHSFSYYPSEVENAKEYGTKTFLRIINLVFTNKTLLLFTNMLFIVTKCVVPLSLDSFEDIIDGGIASYWSIVRVLNIQSALVTAIGFLSEYPVILNFLVSTENILNRLPSYLRYAIFLSFLIAGMLTPTIDAYTQVSLGSLAVILYFGVIFIGETKSNMKVLVAIEAN